jgi:hypothetical protein
VVAFRVVGSVFKSKRAAAEQVRVRIRRFRFRPPSSTLTFPGAIYLEIVGAAAVSGLLSIEID